MNKAVSVAASVCKLIAGVFSRYCFKLPAGMLTAKRLLADRSRTYLAVCDHIGDFLITMGYLDAFKASHSADRITLIVTPKMKTVAEKYIGTDDMILPFGRRKLDNLLYLNTSQFTSQWVEKQKILWLVEPAAHFNEKHFSFMLGFPRVTLRHLIQYGCLRLPEDAAFRPLPLLNETKTDTPSEGRVILCPMAQAAWIERRPTSVFKTLADLLNRQGKTVYTNLDVDSRDEEALPGTCPLRLSLGELESWLGPGDCVIGLRSGLMDFVAYLNCRQICLYPSRTRHKAFYSLDMLPQTRNNYIEYELSGNEEVDISHILDILASFGSDAD